MLHDGDSTRVEDAVPSGPGWIPSPVDMSQDLDPSLALLLDSFVGCHELITL